MECIGPDRSTDYASDVRLAARMLSDHGATFVPLAHRGTLLKLVVVLRENLFSPFTEIEGLGDDVNDCWAFVACHDHKAYWFNLRCYLAGGYVAEKLDIAPADGDTVAEFLTRVYAAWYPSSAPEAIR
jgi:hypothetical protein